MTWKNPEAVGIFPSSQNLKEQFWSLLKTCKPKRFNWTQSMTQKINRSVETNANYFIYIDFVMAHMKGTISIKKYTASSFSWLPNLFILSLRETAFNIQCLEQLNIRSTQQKDEFTLITSWLPCQCYYGWTHKK